jgi:hypothetical protein
MIGLLSIRRHGPIFRRNAALAWLNPPHHERHRLVFRGLQRVGADAQSWGGQTVMKFKSERPLRLCFVLVSAGT